MSSGYNSHARIDSTTLVTWVDAARLRAVLEPLELELLPAAFGAAHEHPISIELWHVVAGELEALGVQQGAWFEGMAAAGSALAASSAGAALGASVGAWGGANALGMWGMALGPVGAWWGACSGFAIGGAWGAAAGASSAAVSGGAVGAQLGQQWSEAASRVFGTYNEALICVPNVRLAHTSHGPARFVLGMYSDGAIPIWGDRMLGCGYAKRLCTIVRDEFRGYAVRERDAASGGLHESTGERAHDVSEADAPTAARDPGLSAHFEPVAGDGWHGVGAELDLHRALSDQPLLGSLGQGRFARTRLERAWCDPDVCMRPVQAQLAVTPPFALGLAPGAVALAPLSVDVPWGAFQIRGLPVRLSDPEPVTRGSP